MKALAFSLNRYRGKGVGMASINANDSDGYPEDSYENMIERAKEKNFPFPYRRDETQAAAKAYGATHTPQLFVFDAALDDLVAGRAPAVAETRAIGCTIKWK